MLGLVLVPVLKLMCDFAILNFIDNFQGMQMDTDMDKQGQRMTISKSIVMLLSYMNSYTNTNTNKNT
jgi:hypothetical protein